MIYRGEIITVNGRFILVILSEDLDRETSETLKAAASDATAQLRIALDARAQQRRWPVLLRAIGQAIAATLIVLLTRWLLVRGGNRLHELMVRRASAHTQRIKLGGIDPEPVLRSLARGTVRLLIWSAAIALVYVWLTFLLLSFPYSQPWGKQLGTGRVVRIDLRRFAARRGPERRWLAGHSGGDIRRFCLSARE